MLLRSIKLEGWRCFANAVSVGEFGDGLNIVHGPNGVGKSTLMMALVRAMFDNHHSAGQDMESLRPWGKDLSPLVELQFEQEGAQYRLTKGFLNRKQSELARREQDRFERFKEARDADEFVRSLLAGEDAKRGVSKPQHWGLAQVLWVPQGNLTLESLTGTAKDMVQQALGAQLKSTASTGIERRIVERFAEIYTSTGKLKQGASAARAVQLEQQLGEAAARLADLRQRLAAFESASRKIDDLRRTAEQIRRREQELATTIAAARARSEEYYECSRRCDLALRELSDAKSAAEEARNRLTAIDLTRNELASDEARHERLLADHALLRAAAEQSESKVLQARAHADCVRSQREQIDTARRQAQDAAALDAACDKFDALSRQVEAIQRVERELVAVRERRGAVICPTPKQLSALRKSESDVREARMRLEASLIILTFVAEETANLKTLAGEPEGNHLVEPGQRLVVRGSPETAIHIAGLGTIRATGPATSADPLRKALAAAEAEYRKQSTGWGSATIEELELALQQAQEIDQELSNLQTRLSTMLGNRTLEQFRAELALAQRAQSDIRTRQAAWQDSPPSPQALQREADRLEQLFRTQIDDAEAKVNAAQAAQSAAGHQLSLQEAEIRATLGRIANARKQLGQLTSDGRDDARRQVEYDALLLQFDVAKAKVAHAEQQLQTFLADPRKETSNLESEHTALRQQRETALASLNREEALLEQLAGEAPYSALADAEEELARLQGDLARERLNAEAIKLLYETLSVVQREAVQAVIDPVKRRAQQTLQRIAGGKFDGIHFGDELLPTGVQPQSAEQSNVALEHLSGGEREQVYFAVRLALADIAFRGRRELLVLDDVFVYTDMTRVARIVSILEEAAERFQIVLLTCHPERYRGIPSAKFFDLAELVHAQTPALPPPPTPIAAASSTAKPAASPPKSRTARGRTFWESVES
jgi:DNA repair exonuclease SbcCD ATPase subunit